MFVDLGFVVAAAGSCWRLMPLGGAGVFLEAPMGGDPG
jgi:hypothetical protein